MRSIKSGLLGLAVASVFGALAVVGCSADGASDDFLDPTQESEPTEPGENQLPSSSGSSGKGTDDDKPSGDAGAKDAAKKDAGKADAGKDAGPPPPEEGESCATPDQVFKRTCGFCGTQTAICLDGKVTSYGECKNQVEDGCTPGASETVACGNCGTQNRTCNNFCKWVGTACTGQPANSCTPGAIELDDTACPAEQYRQKTCKDTCQWGFSAECAAPPKFVNVPPTVGAVNGTLAMFSSSKTVPRLDTGACPKASTWPSASTNATPYAYIEVRNPNPKATKVSIYNSQASGGEELDTVMAYYEGSTIPTTDAARRACLGTVADSGNTALTGGASSMMLASLDGTNAVTIPAGGSVQVYFATYYKYDPSDPSNTTGPIKLNVKTESIAP